MHELSVTESILEITLRHAQAANANKVNNLYLVIGEFASIVDDSVQFYWDIIAKNTIAENAKLHFKRIPVELNCLDCNHSYNPSSDNYECPKCGSSHVQINSGKEFYIDAIDIETTG